MQNQGDAHSRRLRIREILRKNTELTDELNALITIIDSSEQTDNTNQEIKPGDTVVINNQYKGLQGAEGKVISASAKQVTLILKDRRIVRRNKSNVTRIQDHE